MVQDVMFPGLRRFIPQFTAAVRVADVMPPLHVLLTNGNALPAFVRSRKGGVGLDEDTDRRAQLIHRLHRQF